MEAVLSSVSPSIISPKTRSRPFSIRYYWTIRNKKKPSICSTSSSLSSFPLYNSNVINGYTRKERRLVIASSKNKDEEEYEEIERALGMDGSIPVSSDEFIKRVSSRSYDMRRHLNQTLDSVGYDGSDEFICLQQVLITTNVFAAIFETNPWRDDSKPVYVLTHHDNHLCTMKTRQNRSEVERELGLLFSKGGKEGYNYGKKAKPSRTGTNFNMFVEDIREGVLVFEDEEDATKYCDLLQEGRQGCEGIAELEASAVFDICRRMRALAVIFRRGTTPPMPKSLEQNLRARKRSLEDQDNE